MTRVTTQLSCLLSAHGPTTPLLPLLCKNIKDDATYRGAEPAMGCAFLQNPPLAVFLLLPRTLQSNVSIHVCERISGVCRRLCRVWGS